jgi:hypothetical protein
MPLPSPILDDRSYQQLRDELVRRIPVYTPEWTDHNASDPGITLLELFAFLGENLLYRFNQIPEATQLEFLRRLDMPLRAAIPAQAMLAFSTERADGVLAAIGSAAQAGDVAFETLTETIVWPLSAIGVGRVQAGAPDQHTEPEVYALAVRAVTALGPLKSGEVTAYYRNAIVPAGADEAPADLPNTVDGSLWVALKAERNFDRTRLADRVINIGFVPDPAADAMGVNALPPCPGDGPAAGGPAVEWQISLAALADGVPVYRPLKVVGDTTAGLTREGVVRLQLPKDLAPVGLPVPDDPARAGTGLFPPVLDDETQAKLFCWVRAFRVDRSDLPRTQFVCANAATARQSTLARPEFLGTGNGQPGQRFGLTQRPVLDGTAQIEVEEPGGWARWAEVAAFHASAPDDRHFRCDLEAGEIRFGDGERGRVPQIGERIRVVEYRHGGGKRGNVPAKAIAKSAVGGVKVANPLRATGGADTETIEAALERMPGELRRRDRAVTAGDFRELALATPGAAVGRAECLPRFHAPTLTPERPGMVTVVVWPTEDPKHPDAPLPDRQLLRRVCAWLDERRLVTTELYVVPPTYREVAVSIALEVKPGYGVEAVRRWVELVVRQYLAPLPPFGPSGQGWPLGRRVHGPELEAAALQVEGVEFLEGLAVAGRDPRTKVWVPGTVELASHEVPWLSEIVVVAGGVALPAPGTVLEPVVATTPVPVPVERDEC